MSRYRNSILPLTHANTISLSVSQPSFSLTLLPTSTTKTPGNLSTSWFVTTPSASPSTTSLALKYVSRHTPQQLLLPLPRERVVRVIAQNRRHQPLLHTLLGQLHWTRLVEIQYRVSTAFFAGAAAAAGSNLTLFGLVPGSSYPLTIPGCCSSDPQSSTNSTFTLSTLARHLLRQHPDLFLPNHIFPPMEPHGRNSLALSLP
ncbi:MAG: hypothetical protein Q9184_007598, partial [Pyrenodesmia sp. 2 TL-2023]